MNTWVYSGFFLTVLLIAGLSVASGSSGGTAQSTYASHITAGLILGTLIGGASTIGTAQLAYQYGMSAWWFTLGGGLACVVLAVGFAKPLRRQNCPTLVGMITKEYGTHAGLAASILNSVGTFINIIAQLISASAVVFVILPDIRYGAAIGLSALLMVVYGVFGGTRGIGVVGILKLVLLSLSMLLCGTLVLSKIGGVDAFIHLTRGMETETGVRYFSLFARGFGKDLGACLSLIFGVLTTQTYAQAVLCGRTDRSARVGALAAAVLITPIGICGILVGLYMRSVTDPALFDAKTALTEYVLRYSGMPALLAGGILGALFIASVGTGAGLALGVTSVFRSDVLSRLFQRPALHLTDSVANRLVYACVLLFGFLFSVGSWSDTILNFSFLSMGLRGATVFAPLCFLLWRPGQVHGAWALASIILGPVTCLLFGTLWPLKAVLNGWDPLFPGILASAIPMAAGAFVRKRYTAGRNTIK